MKRTGLTRKEFLKTAGAAGLALLGGGTLAGCAPDEGLRNPAPPDGGTGGIKNVVLVILDSLRKDHVGAYGNGWIETPNLDALAGESLRFTRPYPESAPTVPARRAIHTGARVWPYRDYRRYKGIDIRLYGWQPIREDQRTLAETLQGNGYRTMMVTDNLHQYTPSMNFQRGFEAFDFFRGQTTDPYKPPWTAPPEKVAGAIGSPGYLGQYFANTADWRTEEDRFAPRVFSRASEFLELAAGGADPRPFFMTVDCYDPHAPYDPPEEYVGLYDGEPFEGPEPILPIYGPSDRFTDRQLERMRARYAGEVTMMDRWLGRFLDKMRELNLLDDTLLVLLSDHGIAHGEHGVVGKAPGVLWPEVTDVIFLVRHPRGKGAGKTSDFFASTHDVAPTILGALGIEPPDGTDGEDLSVILAGGEPGNPREHFSLGYHDHVFTRDEDHAMFCRNDGTDPRLYDLREDPEMRNDLAGERPDVAKEMFEGYVVEDAGGEPPPT